MSEAVLSLPPISQKPRFTDVTLSGGIIGDEPSANFPDLPSLLRKENRRFLMNRIDTTTIPDFKSLTDIAFDHDLFVATQMISFDTVTGFSIGNRDMLGRPVDERDRDDLIRFDEAVDIAELYRVVTLDVIRFGNSLVWDRYEGKRKRRMVDARIIHPGKIVDMKINPTTNVPMWWVFRKTDVNGNDMNYIAFVDPKHKKEFSNSSYSNAEIVGEATDIVHFKGSAPPYQKWGIGITQIAKILIEAKLDMLVDFSKIIKREASPKEYVYVNTTGLTDDNRRRKIKETIKSVNKQRKLGSIIVLEMNESEVKMVGSEGKVLDNFSLHYRDDILRAIRILTRIPPSFWLGEATNKATINSQLIVYNRYLNSIRWSNNRMFARGIFLPYIQTNFNPAMRLSQLPAIIFPEQAIEDAMDRAMIDDLAVRNGTKSRKQVAEERGYRLPEEDGEYAPELSSQSPNGIIMDEIKKESMGVRPSL